MGARNLDPADPRVIASIAQARAKGMIATEGAPVYAKAKARRAKQLLVAAAFTPPNLWVIPLHVVAGDNQRGKVKIGRAGHERRAVFRVLAKYHREFAPFADAAQAGRPLVCRLTRVGGREMDDDGLHSSCKYVRDAVAEWLGVGDGPRGPVRWEYASEPGGACGVRVQITTELT